LTTKEAYQERVGLQRCDTLREWINRYRPPIVTFYGRSFRKRWHQIVGKSFAPVVGYGDIEQVKVDSTHCFLVPHPTARGVKPQVFDDLGLLMKAL